MNNPIVPELTLKYIKSVIQQFEALYNTDSEDVFLWNRRPDGIEQEQLELWGAMYAAKCKLQFEMPLSALYASQGVSSMNQSGSSELALAA